MAITLVGTGGYFTRAGLLAGGLNEVNTFRGTTVGTTRVNNIRAQFNSADQALVDNLYQSGASYQGIHGSWLSYLSQLSSSILIQMAQDSSPLKTGQLSEALTVLIAQMKGSSDTIKANVVSVAVTTGTNTGDGVVAASVVAADGGKLENVFAETMTATVTADSFSGGATEGSEPLSVLGILGPSDPLHWNFAVSGYGSNARAGITAIDATTSPSSSGNIVNNGDMADWGAVSANLPNQWTVVTGVPGTDILKYTASPYEGSAALEFLGDGATLSGIKQQFNSTSGTVISLAPRKVIAVCLRTKVGASAPAAGSLRISLVDGSGTVINNDAGTANQFNIDLTAETTAFAAHTGFFQLPSILPAAVYLKVALSTAITAAKFVVIDHLAACFAQQMYNASPTNNIAGGPYVTAFSGTTAFVVNDTFAIAVSQSYGGKFQTALWKFYNTPQLGVRVPSVTGGAETINDGLCV